MSSKHMYSTANLSDVELKEQGNRLFSTRKYEDAINCYSKAIIKNPSMATYFTNRALCHLKLKKWDATCQDCRRALDMDPQLVKGHFFLGQSLLELELYDEAIKHLQRACDLAKEQRRNFGDDIASQLRLARKKRFQVQEEKRMQQEIELQTYLNRLIMDDIDNRIGKLRLDRGESAANASNTTENGAGASAAAAGGAPAASIAAGGSNSKSSSVDSITDDRATQSTSNNSQQSADSYEVVGQLEQERDNRLAEVNDLFAKIDDLRRKRDVPDYLCGKISFEILSEPVITPSGITYERKDIEEHLQRVGHFDPVTRVKLTQDQLIPNFSMKEVVDAFVMDNEWALDY